MENRKLLWHSNAPWSPTGYGQQTGLFLPFLKEHYDLAVSSFYGLEGARLMWEGVPVFPGIGADFGNVFMRAHAKEHFGSRKGGLVVTLMDVWVLDPGMASQLNMACWVPVDHEPPIEPVTGFFHKSGAVPIAMSKFGQEQLKARGLDPLYVPHGVDTEVFRPYDRDHVRAEAQVPEGVFLVGMVAANKGNPSRKGFAQALQAFRIFREKHDNARLYLHTVADSRVAAGEDLQALARALGIFEACVWAPPYKMMYDPFPPSGMAQLYSALDVLLNPSFGEGFGVPILEAAACGTPAIVTNFSSMPEVAGPAGWPVGFRPWWTNGKSWQAMPDVLDIVEALELCYCQSRKEREARSAKAREHAQAYDVRTVLDEYMLPALEASWQRFEARKPVEAIS